MREEWAIPAASALVVQPGGRRHAMSCASRAEDPHVQVLPERHPPLRARVCRGVVLADPSQLRGEIRSVEDATGPRVGRHRIDLAPQLRGRAARARISPREHARGRPALRVHADQAVPERRRGNGRDLAGPTARTLEDGVDRSTCRLDALVRIDGGLAVGRNAHRPVRVRDKGRDRPRARVEEEHAQPRRSDIEREHERGARLAQRDRERLAQHRASMRATKPSPGG